MGYFKCLLSLYSTPDCPTLPIWLEISRFQSISPDLPICSWNLPISGHFKFCQFTHKICWFQAIMSPDLAICSGNVWFSISNMAQPFAIFKNLYCCHRLSSSKAHNVMLVCIGIVNERSLHIQSDVYGYVFNLFG